MNAQILASGFIIACLGLQLVTGFGFMFKRLWPFICYPMYSIPHFQGENVPIYSLIGVKADGTEVQMTPEDMGLGLSYHLWQKRPVTSMRVGTFEDLPPHLERYKKRTGNLLREVKLINSPARMVEGKIEKLPPITVATYRVPEQP